MAYGIATATMNTAQAVTPLLVARVRAYRMDSSMELFFACTAVISMGVSAALYLVDRRNGGDLQRH